MGERLIVRYEYRAHRNRMSSDQYIHVAWSRPESLQLRTQFAVGLRLITAPRQDSKASEKALTLLSAVASGLLESPDRLATNYPQCPWVLRT
jgi:hypothetical protein